MRIPVWLQDRVIIGLICTVLVGVWYEFDIAGLRQQYLFTKHQEQNLLAEHKNLLHQQMMLEESVGQYAAVENGLNEWQKKFIKARDLKKLVIAIKAIGKANKLQFRAFDAATLVKENNYLKQSFQAIIVGDYLETANFIKQIAKLPWIVVVGDFAILPYVQQGLMQTQIKLNVYYLEKKVRK
jgi:Tfp pilus assembly protein PilO